MGLGHPYPTETKDLMESMIVETPCNNAERFRNRVYKHVIKHRDLFGYPKGCGSGPYIFVSSDLSGIFMGLLDMIKKLENGGKDVPDIALDLPNILKLLIRRYDDVEKGKCDHGCCGFYHSIDKDTFMSVQDAFKAHMSSTTCPETSHHHK